MVWEFLKGYLDAVSHFDPPNMAYMQAAQQSEVLDGLCAAFGQ